MKRVLEGIFLLSCIIIFWGCGDTRKNMEFPPAVERPGGVNMEARPLEIGSETYQADLGTVTVPENRSVPTSRLITLPFVRIHARSQHPAEPIVGLAGGPGTSNMAWDWGKAAMFLSDHDFVVAGYRGVDGSTVLDCPEVTEAFKAGHGLLSEESLQRIGQAWRASAKRLRGQGVDLDGYSMLECIEDIEAVRSALGYEKIDLLSESYGTRVAYLYALKHPDQVSRSAMIGVNPPGHFVWEPQTIDTQLRYYAALWSKDPVMSSRSPDLYATMSAVLRAMPRRWLLFSIDPGRVRVVTFALLFHRSTAAMVFDAYLAAERGDPSGLALMSMAYDYVVPSMMTWGDLASKAVSADYDPTRDYALTLDPPDLPLGSPMARMLWAPLHNGTWPMKQLPEEFRRLQQSHGETLLLSGSVDFSTPAEASTKELLPNLPNGRQVILSEYGHVGDVWYVNPQNTRVLLTSFYKTGVPDTSLNVYVPMNFGVTWGFPVIAKLILSLVAVVTILIATGAFWLLRRYRRRHSLEVTPVHY